jgi:hypothetical protein
MKGVITIKTQQFNAAKLNKALAKLNKPIVTKKLLTKLFTQVNKERK